MGESPSAPVDESDGLSTDEAFALLGNDTRIAILYALWEAHEPFADDDAVPFSDLRKRIEMRNSGRFNYHLDRLTGQFVERTEAGYELRYRGLKLMHAVVAGSAIDDSTLEPTEIDEECPVCGAPTAVSYEGDRLFHVCTECEGFRGTFEEFPDGTIAAHSFAPAGLSDRSPEEILDAERQQAKHRRGMMVEGVCPECSGRVEPDVTVCDDHDGSETVCRNCGSRGRIHVYYTCSVCKHAWLFGPKLAVATHPAVVGFYYERGVEFDVASRDASGFVREWKTELAADDPLRVRVTVPYEGDALRVTLDDEMDVVEVEAA